jgi:valyl-tRNA synthetase
VALKDNEDFLEGLKVEGKLIEVIEELDGMDRFAARKEIVSKMEEIGCSTISSRTPTWCRMATVAGCRSSRS